MKLTKKQMTENYRGKDPHMNKIKIITDSCSDLSPELLEKYDLDYAQMNTVYNEKTIPASLSWEYYSPSEFYQQMRDGKRITTTQVPVEEFQRIFSEYISMGYDIIYIGCSNKLSGSINTGTLVAKKMMQENPGAKIVCIDSLNASIGIGMLAIKAAELAKSGLDIYEIEKTINSIRNNVRQYVTVHSLEFLKRAGRVTGSAAFFGNLLGVKPILVSDVDGYNVPIKKVKGRGASIKELISLLKDTIVDAESQTVYIINSDCDTHEVDQLKKMLSEEINCKDICVLTLGPIIGASIGPEAIGLFAFGQEVTYKSGE